MPSLAHAKDYLSIAYYVIGGVSLLLTLIRILYGWFRDFDNSSRFSADMALVHLPYIYKSLQLIGDKLDAPLEPAPVVSFSKDPHQA